jgi:hypothetical protein
MSNRDKRLDLLDDARRAAVACGAFTWEAAYEDQYRCPPPPAANDELPTPQELPSGMPAVPEFEPGLLPAVLAVSVMEISESKQAPADFPAITSMVALSSLVARHVAIRPMENGDWTESPNLWGMSVGRPAAKKSPSMSAALRPFDDIEELADADYENAQTEFSIVESLHSHQLKADSSTIQKKLKSRDPNDRSEALSILQEQADRTPEAPLPTRYLVNDATVEKLADLQQNNACILVFRDELQGFFASLERHGQEQARSYYLEAWSGLRPFKVDRISRGSTRIPRACVSVLGSIQPGPLSSLMRELNKAHKANDGLLQRFQLAVYPDLSDHFRLIDARPDPANLEAVQALYSRMAALDPGQVGAESDEQGMPFLRFAPDAQEIFNDWLEKHENRLRTDDLAECMESHLGKYQSLVASLALILHLADGGYGAVGAESLLRYGRLHGVSTWKAMQNAFTPRSWVLILRRQKPSLAR